jgi:hypothetical protein
MEETELLSYFATGFQERHDVGRYLLAPVFLEKVTGALDEDELVGTGDAFDESLADGRREYRVLGGEDHRGRSVP